MQEDNTPLLDLIVARAIWNLRADLDPNAIGLQQRLGTDAIELNTLPLKRKKLSGMNKFKVGASVSLAMLRALMKPKIRKKVEDRLKHNCNLFNGSEDKFADKVAHRLANQIRQVRRENMEVLVSSVHEQLDSTTRGYVNSKYALTQSFFLCASIAVICVVLTVIFYFGFQESSSNKFFVGKPDATNVTAYIVVTGVVVAVLACFFKCLVGVCIARHHPTFEISAGKIVGNMSFTIAVDHKEAILAKMDAKEDVKNEDLFYFPVDLDNIAAIISNKQIETFFNNASDELNDDMLRVVTKCLYEPDIAQDIINCLRPDQKKTDKPREAIELPGLKKDEHRLEIVIDEKKKSVDVEMIPAVSPPDRKIEEEDDEKMEVEPPTPSGPTIAEQEAKQGYQPPSYRETVRHQGLPVHESNPAASGDKDADGKEEEPYKAEETPVSRRWQPSSGGIGGLQNLLRNNPIRIGPRPSNEDLDEPLLGDE